MKRMEMNKTGLTLSETLVTILIFALMSGVIYLFLMAGIGSWGIGSTRTELQSQARYATDYMVAELKNASTDAQVLNSTDGLWYARSVSIPSATEIKFYLPTKDSNGVVVISGGALVWPPSPDGDGDYVNYVFLSSSNQLLRQEGTQQSVLSNDVSGVTFATSGGNVSIDLQLERDTARGRTISFQSRSTVKIRN